MIGFCLSYSVKNCSPLDRFVRPQLVSLIIHLQFGCVLPCSCLCSSICRQGLAFVVRSTGQRMVDNQETTWCFDCGLRSCWSEAGSLVSCRRQIDSYPPDGRSGAPVPIRYWFTYIIVYFFDAGLAVAKKISLDQGRSMNLEPICLTVT